MYNCIVLRYGEIGLKSRRTRPWFEKKYTRAIKEALDRVKVSGKVQNLGARFVVHTAEVEKALKVLARVAGIQSLSPAVCFAFDDKKGLLEEVKKYGSLVEGKTFAARVKRVGKHDFSSQSLAKEVGDTLYGFSVGVDLTNPDVAVNVEVRDQEAFLFVDSTEGVGGLPVDSTQKVLCLFSGGMDSPVAAYQLMKRGCAVDFCFINMQGEKSLYEAAKVYNYLTENYWFGHKPKFYHVDARKVVERILSSVPDRLRQVVLKVAFYQIANSFDGYTAIATGEALSQKSSQTLQSLAVLNSFSEKLVLRPVLGMDKIEVMKIARQLGTYAASEKVTEYCGLAKGAVTTVPKLEEIQANVVDVSDVTVDVFRGMVEVEGVVSEEVSGDSVVVDIRDEVVQEEVPIDADLSYEYPSILEKLDEFEKGKQYIIICTFGVKSDEVAFALVKKGVKAVSMSTAVFKKYLKNK